MEYIIKGRKPEKFFNYFEEISAIPRGSGNEKGIADYIVAFAKKRGLECYRDEINNVFVTALAFDEFRRRRLFGIFNQMLRFLNPVVDGE